MCGGPLETRRLKAGDPDAAGLRLVRVRVLHGSEGRGGHDHRDAGSTGSCSCAGRSSRATGCGCFRAATSIAARSITAAALREAQGRVRPRRPARRPDQHLLLLRPLADHRRLRRDRRSGGELCGDDECLEAGLFTPDRSRGTSSPSAARPRRCRTISTASGTCRGRRA